MENILSYFGTYTPAADGAIAGFQFEYLTSLGFAAIVIFLGRFIIDHYDDPAGLHAGQAHQADVLREAGVGEGVEDAAQQGG